MGLPEKKYISIEEYLETETKSLEKNEYYNGEIFAMAGASLEHNRILSNTLIELGNKLKGKNCIPYASDLRIKVAENSLYTYPDITIICGEVKKSEDSSNTVTNPTILFEILSESTKDYDRGSKFKLYREIESLQDYIIIDSTGSHQVEKFTRNEQEETWVMSEYSNINNEVYIRSIDVKLSLEDIYFGVY